MKVTSIELTHHHVPFTPHADSHLKYWLPHWQITQICRLEFDNGITGWGETIPNYTWSKVPDDVQDRIIGEPAARLMWDDSLGAGVQMALFDAVAKALKVPVYALLGRKIRDWCPISWWNMDMPPEGWAEECRQAVEAGYTSAKLKARPWFDLHAAIRAVKQVVPEGFHLDLDYNATLGNAANAVQHLKQLEQYEEVAIVESPIPQSDVAGNRQIRDRINRPVAMHFGQPPVMTTMKEDVTDGFVLCTGAASMMAQATACNDANKPFWLQLVGTGLTTAWAAHLGAVLPQAKWPAITCMNIWENQLLQTPHQVQGGFYRVPNGEGLGVSPNADTLKRTAVDYTTLDPPRHVYRYIRSSGEVTVYACSKQELHQVYPKDALPISEPGSRLDVQEDDGSEAFDRMYKSALDAPIKERKRT
jgi:L-alanine-DL-glutamate epimerase-like enolase superfamily enzyme